jgi:hypothetical protein
MVIVRTFSWRFLAGLLRTVHVASAFKERLGRAGVGRPSIRFMIVA